MLCCPLWIQLEITQPPSEDNGSASALGKTGSFPPESLLCFALDVQILLCPGRSISNIVTSSDEFLKGLKVTSGTSQLLFQFLDHLAASWIFNIFLHSFQPRESAERTKLCWFVLGHPWRCAFHSSSSDSLSPVCGRAGNPHFILIPLFLISACSV